MCARGASHRTLADAELIRWDAPFARIEARREQRGVNPLELDVTLVREGPAGGRKRIRVNGVPRRATALAGLLEEGFQTQTMTGVVLNLARLRPFQRGGCCLRHSTSNSALAVRTSRRAS